MKRYDWTVALFHSRLEEWRQVASWSGAEIRTHCAVRRSSAESEAVLCSSLRTGLFASSLTVLGGIIMLLADVYIKYTSSIMES